MLLTELVMHNFGVYKGRHVISLTPPTPSQNVVLVGGLNGAGKTTFLDALQLSLFGSRARTSNRGSAGFEEYLRHCISRTADPADGATLEIAFTVEREGRPTSYRVRRQWAAQGSRVRERLEVSVNGHPDTVLAANWPDHVEEILPLEIASLFFFDGEKIEALADPDRAQSVIKAAVHSLLGVGVVDRLGQDLMALQRRQKPLEADQVLAAKVAGLRAAAEAANSALDAATSRADTARDELGFARMALDKSERRLEAAGGGLLERRLEIEAERAIAAARVEHLLDDLRQLASGPLPLRAIPGLVRTVVCQAEAEARGEQDSLIQSLLCARDEAVLGALQASSDADAATVLLLAGLLEADRDRRAARSPGQTYLRLTPEARGQLTNLPVEIAASTDRLHATLDSLERAEHALAILDRTLAAVPEADAVADLLRVRDEARYAAQTLEGKRDALQDEQSRLARQRDDCNDKLERAIGLQIEQALRSEDTARLVEFAERARATLAAYRSQLLARHIGKLEVAVLASLRTLLRKGRLVQDLRINASTFELELFGSEGRGIRPDRLSAGERQMLAVAILWGLARVAGHRLPTIIDTPLGRLDSEHRRHLVERYFPKASRQVLLLSTDEEIDADLQDRLRHAVGHSYLIQYNEDTDSSTIEPGYFWKVVQRVA